MGFTDYQVLVLLSLACMNAMCGGIVVFFCYAIIRFKEFRDGLIEAIQDGDEIFHWKDAKSFGYFVGGCVSAWFTMDMAGVLAYEKMFDVGPMAFLGILITVTFSLWGIAWKKG